MHKSTRSTEASTSAASAPPSFLSRWQNRLVFILVVLAIWLPRSQGLDCFATTDETLWLARSANFYFALSHGDFASTYQKEHPGVTVMWAGAAGFLQRFPEYRDSPRGQLIPDDFNDYISRRSAPVSPVALLQAGRTFIVLAHTFILGVGFLYASQLLGLWPALLAFLLVAFDPFHLGLTRLLHVDGLFSNLVLLALLAYLGYLQRRRLLDLLVAGAAAGSAWLTKTPALFIVPVIGLLTLVEIWRPLSPAESRLARLWRASWPALAWLAAACLVFVAAWPAMWVQPVETLNNMWVQGGRYVQEGHNSALFFNGELIEDGNIHSPSFYPLTYLWRSTPVVLAGLLLAAWGFFKRWSPFDRAGVRRLLFGLLLLVVVFLIGMSFPLKKFDRYLLPAYAPLDILAGLGWYSLAALIWNRKAAGRLQAVAVILAAAVVGFQLAGSLATHPYYLTYYNPLLGGGRKAPEVMLVGWGEGLDQAARYLNQKPKGRSLTVISWYGTGPFSYFFEGNYRSFGFDARSSEDEWARFLKSDYAVIYISMLQRQLNQPILDYVAQLQPEHTVWLNGIEYARIYKIH